MSDARTPDGGGCVPLHTEKPGQASYPASLEVTSMAGSATLFRNPLFRWGIPAMTAVVAIGFAFFLIDHQLVRWAIVAVAVADLLVTPQILKRAV